MPPKQVVTFDPSVFLTLPILSARSLLSLVDGLVEAAPVDRSEPVEAALDQMIGAKHELSEVIDERHRGQLSVQLGVEADLDTAGDTGWVYTRDRLRGLTSFARPGFVRMASEPAPSFNYKPRVNRARRAQALLDQLFGPAGSVDFVRSKYTEQVQTTASILRIIEDDGLAAELDAVVGEDITAMLRDLQARYEAMVAERSARESSRVEDLKSGVVALRAAIQMYAVTVMGMANPKQPESLELVAGALRPIVHFREQALRARGGVRVEGEGEGAEDQGEGEGGEVENEGGEAEVPAAE